MKKMRLMMFFTFAILALVGCGKNISGEFDAGVNSEANTLFLGEQNGETMKDPTVCTDRDGIIAFIGDIFIEPEGATDITYSYEGDGLKKYASMHYNIDGVLWTASYSTGETYFQRYYPKREDYMFTSIDNYGFGRECMWKGLDGEPEYIYYKYDKDYMENAYVYEAVWFFEDTQEVYRIGAFGPTPEKIEPERVFKY